MLVSAAAMTESTASQADPKAALLELLAPILTRVAELEPASRAEPEQIAALEAALDEEFPPGSERVRAIGEAVREGVDAGWLCDRGEPNARFSRLAKPSEATHGLSIDVVSMEGDAVDHTHPNGEVTIGFSAHEAPSEDLRFEERPPGWVFLGPGSRHIPRVSGGRMNLVYFLPEGAVEWHFD